MLPSLPRSPATTATRGQGAGKRGAKPSRPRGAFRRTRRTPSCAMAASEPVSAAMSRHPYAFHVGLDGNGLNGVEGHGGVCVFWFDPKSGDYDFKVKFYDGIASGHAVSVNPSRTVGFLGN